jgi:uncharacterized membrane protein YbhN (UPF0104 family)
MRKAVSLLAKAAVSGLLLYLALNFVNLETVASRLARVEPGWLGLMVAALLTQTGLLALRWGQILERCGAPLAFRELFRISMIAIFFNQTLPSSAGGDVMRIWLVARQTNWRSATYSVFLDRVIGVIALALLVVACLPWSLALVSDPVGRAALLLIGLGFLGAGAVFVSLAWNWVPFLDRWSATRHLIAAAAVARDIFRAPRTLARVFTLSVLIHLLTALAAWCAARSVGANLSPLYALYLVLPVVLVAIVPISIAGWGVRESAMVTAFAYAGLPQADGLIVSLLLGAGQLALGIVGGLVWIASRPKAT